MAHYIRACEKNKKYKTKCKDHLQKPEKYRDYERDQNLKFVENFEDPMDPSNIYKFEKDNIHLNISVNVFIMQKLCGKYIVSPYHVTESKKENHINLWLAQDHYIDKGDKKKKTKTKRTIVSWKKGFLV